MGYTSKAESNKWTNKTWIKLIGSDNSMVFSRGNEVVVLKYKGGQIYDDGTRFDFDWAVGTLHSIQMMYHKTVHLRPI